MNFRVELVTWFILFLFLFLIYQRASLNAPYIELSGTKRQHGVEYFCNDWHPLCSTWSNRGLCEGDKIKWIPKVCNYSCKTCKQNPSNMEPYATGMTKMQNYSFNI